MIKVFLSRPNPFTEEQAYFITKFTKLLKLKNIDCITLQAKDYSPYEVINCLNEMISKCYGMIIVSFGHTYVEMGCRKKGAIKSKKFFQSAEIDFNKKWITSVYCHIEGTMALANNLPTLILNQKGINEEGIIKKGEHAHFTQKFELLSKDKINDYFKDQFFVEVLTDWEQKVKEKYNFINDVTIQY